MEEIVVFEELLFAVRAGNVYLCILIGLVIWYIFQAAISGR